MSRPVAHLETLVEHYQRLLGAVLEHTWIDHEGSELAIGDFRDSDDRAWPVLQLLINLQGTAHELGLTVPGVNPDVPR